jgi:hypothetical protein
VSPFPTSCQNMVPPTFVAVALNKHAGRRPVANNET